MISAKELKEKQTKLRQDRDIIELKEIEQKLLDAITTGKTCIYLNFITISNFNYLESLGYKVEQHYDQKDGDWVRITW